MADINIQMTQRNVANTDWDNVFPATKAPLVKFTDGTDAETRVAALEKKITDLSSKIIFSNAIPTKLEPEQICFIYEV